MTLLDSNVLIQYLKGTEPLTSRVQAASPVELAIPSIVVCELEYGTLRIGSSRRRTVLSHVLANLQEVPFDRAAARETARIRVDLERSGMVIGPLDLLIAGTAVSRNAILVTNNLDEFGRIRELRLEDWSR